MKRGMEPFLVLNRTISSKSVGFNLDVLKEYKQRSKGEKYSCKLMVAKLHTA